MTTTFLHLNGPPAIGKSTIAAALVDMRPLSLLIEIDVLRTWFGQWADQASSKGLAREIAYSMASAHLRRGLDVVLPQLDAREEVITRLATIAREQSVRFLEVVLTDRSSDLAARVARTNARSGSRGRTQHPRDLLRSDELARQTAYFANELERMAMNLSDVIRIDVTGLSPPQAAEHVRSAIGW